MVKRRYANYLGDGDPRAGDDTKPSREGRLPSRAWFERTATTSEGPWGMTVEHEQRFATNHQGEFNDLVEAAKAAGVSQFYVWSAEDSEFLLHTSQTVIEPPVA